MPSKKSSRTSSWGTRWSLRYTDCCRCWSGPSSTMRFHQPLRWTYRCGWASSWPPPRAYRASLSSISAWGSGRPAIPQSNWGSRSCSWAHTRICWWGGTRRPRQVVYSRCTDRPWSWCTEGHPTLKYYHFQLNNWPNGMIYVNVIGRVHFSTYLMLRRCLNSLGSGYSVFFLMLSRALCRINFLSSLILISFNLSSFSFSFRINSFFYYSNRLWWSSLSTLWIFYCQWRSDSLFSRSRFAISSYN